MPHDLVEFRQPSTVRGCGITMMITVTAAAISLVRTAQLYVGPHSKIGRYAYKFSVRLTNKMSDLHW